MANNNGKGDGNVAALIGTIILMVIGFVMYPLIGDPIADMTNASAPEYVGASSAPIVGMIPVFYFLALALAIIGMALVTIKGNT